MTTNWHYHNDWASSPADRNAFADREAQRLEQQRRADQASRRVDAREVIDHRRWNFDDAPASDTPSQRPRARFDNTESNSINTLAYG